MLFLFDFQSKGQTVYKNRIPLIGKKYLIEYAQPSTASSNKATIFLQQIIREGFTITLAIFLIKEAVSIYPYLPTPSLALSYQLEGTSIACVLKGVGKVVLKQGKYNLFYLPAGYQTANFKKGFYMNLFCELSPRFLEKLSSQHEKVKELIAKLNSVSSKGQMLQPGTIPHDFNVVKQDILKNSKRGTALDLELEAAILRLLSNFEQELSRKQIHANDPLEEIVEKIKEYIQINILEPRINVHNISTLYNMGVRKLERVFKRETGNTMMEFHLREKMKRALILLLQTNTPIKSVAADVGYMEPSAFIRTFKRFYKCSPTAARQNPNSITTLE